MDNYVSFWQESTALPLLTPLTLSPLLAMMGVLMVPRPLMVRSAFAGSLLTLVLSFALLFVFSVDNRNIQLYERYEFAGMSYAVGVDGANILFVPLTAVLSFLALIYTLITRHANDRIFIACLLAYEGILIGAFVALNVLQFWLWTVLELFPLTVLTLHAGTGHRRRLVIDSFMQYWISGLLMTLTGFLLLAFGLIDSEHPLTFDWLTLKLNNAYLHDEVLIFILLFYGFAIRMPLFPFHGWLPMLAEHGTVAGVLVFMVGIKLGIYAVVRFILPIVPGVAEEWAGLVLTLSVISIFYGAMLALAQINMRVLLAFAVISHTGMLMIGLFCFNEFGLEGSILLSIAYGLATAGMLFSVGLIYERTRTAYIPRLGGLFDTNLTLGLLFLVSVLSTMVMPGTPGFDAAHLLIEGTIEEHGWLIAICILTGNVLAAAFLLWAFQRLFLATPKRFLQPVSAAHHPVREERIIAGVICSLLIGTGFYMTPWLNYIDQEAVDIRGDYPVHGSLEPESLQTDEKDMH
ncbi:MAG: complex I subunit 4 family protein [Gammaproteobacteria bacterium]